VCEDGGETGKNKGKNKGEKANCEVGADCTDCGPRVLHEEFPTATHRVRRYETLNGVAEKWGIRSGALQVWNRIGDPRLLQVNQELIVTKRGAIEEERKNINSRQWSRAMRSARAKALEMLLGETRLPTLTNMYGATELLDKEEKQQQGGRKQQQEKQQQQQQEQCVPPTPTSLLQTPLKILTKRKASDLIELEREYGPPASSSASFMSKAFWWSPPDCEPIDTVAIVIPFRQRESFLPNLLARLHPLLRKQKLRYHIFIIEQIDHKPFNRAKLLNVGAVEATKHMPDTVWWSFPNLMRAMSSICYVFHDIDLIPTSDATPYGCSRNANPRHLSVFVDTHGSKCVYSEIFGGVTSITASQLVALNGYSNLYWGWGGEDDDMSARIRRGCGLKISRPVSCYKKAPHGFGSCSFEANCMDQVEIIPSYLEVGREDGKGGDIGHYEMVDGSTSSIDGGKAMNPMQQAQLIVADRRMHEEGMSTLEYRVVSTEHHATYTRVRVEL